MNLPTLENMHISEYIENVYAQIIAHSPATYILNMLVT